MAPQLGHAQAQVGGNASRSSAYAELVAKGVAEFQAARYQEAYQHFERAHQLEPNARTLRGLGVVEHKLGHFARATKLLEQALHDSRNRLTDAQRVEATELLRDMAASIGRYRVEREPSTATLSVDGIDVELATDEVLVLDSGVHELVLRAPGYATRSQQLTVRGSEQASMSLHLAALAQGPTATDAAPFSPNVPADPGRSYRDDGEPAASKSWQRTAAWVGLGVAGGALTGSVVAWRASESKAAKWNSDNCLAGGKTRADNCQGERAAATKYRTWSIIGLVAGVALGAGSAVLFATAPHPSTETHARARCGAGPGTVGLACSVVF